MRWLIRSAAVLSVASWIVVAGLLAHPVVAVPEPHVARHAVAPAAGVESLPLDWPRRVLSSAREVFPGVGAVQAASVMPMVERYAGRFRVDPLLVLAVIHVESRFDPTAVSPQGAIGLMQLQAGTARGLADDVGLEWTGDDLLFDPNVNIWLGCAYLRQLIDRFGDRDAALAAYAAGPTFVEAQRGATGRIPLAYSDRVWDVWTALHGRVAA